MTKFEKLKELNKKYQRLNILRKYGGLEKNEYNEKVLVLKERLQIIRER